MFRASHISTLMLSVAILASTAAAANAQTVHYVDQKAGAGGDGETWATAFQYLQDALAIASPTDQVWVAAGTYWPDLAEGGTLRAGDREATFQVYPGISIYGGFAGGETELEQRDWEANVTILSGDLNEDDGPDFTNYADNSYNVVSNYDTDPTTIMDGFTVRGGNANGPWEQWRDVGGGMFVGLGDPTIANCTFAENRAEYGGGGVYCVVDATPEFTNCTFADNFAGNCGGGMDNDESAPVLIDCTFTGNSSDAMGGAIFNLTCQPELTGCDFVDNWALFGGAIDNWEASPTLRDCTFTDNFGDYVGGGMSNWLSSPTLTNCSFIANESSSGGGIHNEYTSNPTLVNCAFYGNISTLDGGGFDNDDSNPTLVNCVFSGNQAARYGGGLSNYALEDNGPTLINCTFYGNNADLEGGGLCSSGLAPPFAMHNAILWGNEDEGGTDESAQFHYHSGAPAVTYSCIQGLDTFTGNGNVGDDPLLLDPDGPDDTLGTADDDLCPGSGSPSIDAGDNTVVPADTLDIDNDDDTAEPTPLDLVGQPRFVDHPAIDDTGFGDPPLVDMGAYEVVAFVTGDLNCDGALNAFDIDPFALALGNPAGYAAAFPDCDANLADCNHDGLLNAFDIDPFVVILSAGG